MTTSGCERISWQRHVVVAQGAKGLGFDGLPGVSPPRPRKNPQEIAGTKALFNGNQWFWANDNDLNRAHRKLWFSKGIPPKIPLTIQV